MHRSVIVQAPAGSGKTTLLVTRYLKLLAVVDRPEEVLAITFTRKAAGEMAHRVQDALASAAAGKAADTFDAARALARSRERGWRLLEQPARLKIQTIDSLAMTLTRGLPLAAGFDPRLALTDAADGLYSSAARRHLLRLYESGPLVGEIADFLEQCGNDAARAERLLAAMLAKRDQWLDVILSVVRTHQTAPANVGAVLEVGLRALNERVVADFREAIGERLADELEALVDEAASRLDRSVAEPHQRYHLAAELLTTQQDTFRRQVNRRQGFGPEHARGKARLMVLIDALAGRDLAQQVSNLRYLPDPNLSDEAVHRLVTASINLALANAELTATFQVAGRMDFTSLILDARAALGDVQAPTELALALDYRIHHLLVDEFQDTSVSQFRLLERLLAGWTAGDGNSFFAVGDPMQSIYRFRDADVGLFDRVWQEGIADLRPERVVLASNFRADARLVRWTNGAFGRILGNGHDPVLGRIAYRAATPTLEAAGPGPAVRLHRYATPADQVDGIVERIEVLLARPEASVALLVRARSQLTDLVRALRARGIPWHASDIEPLVDKPAVRDLLSLVEVLSDPYDRLAWFSVLRAPFVGLTLADLQRLAAVEPLPALLDAVARGHETPLSTSGTRRLARLAGAWRQAVARLHELPPRSVVETFWLELGGADAYADPTAVLDATRLLTLMDSLGPRAMTPEALAEAAVTLFAEDVTQSRLEILTVHKAKGLEFDHVLLPFLERITPLDEADLLLWRALPEGLLMGVRDDGGPHAWLTRENRFRDRHEQMRLLYVACTRARQSLTLFATGKGRPKDRSALALLAPLLDTDMSGDMSVVDVPDRGGSPPPVQTDLFEAPDDAGSPPPLIRLVDDYRWQPPRGAPLTVQPSPAPAPAAADPLAAREEVVLGIMLHAALEQLAHVPLPVDVVRFVNDRLPSWTDQAGGELRDPDAAKRVATAVSEQLAGVLNDPDGRRLLEARTDAYAELAVTTHHDGLVENLVIDRIFVSAGVRWLVDYKTSVPPAGMSPEAFLHTEVARYRRQLHRYGTAARALYGEMPRLAIYFTALPRLVEVEPPG